MQAPVFRTGQGAALFVAGRLSPARRATLFLGRHRFLIPACRKSPALKSQRCSGNGRRPMTFRSASPLRSIVALLLLFAVVFHGTVEANACDQKVSSAEQLAKSADSAPTDDKSGDQAQQHALCTHGHCHNFAQLDRDQAWVDTPPPADSLHFSMSPAALTSAELIPFKEPPRA